MKHTPRHVRRAGAMPRPVTSRIDAPGATFPPPPTVPLMGEPNPGAGDLSPLNRSIMARRFRIMWAQATAKRLV